MIRYTNVCFFSCAFVFLKKSIISNKKSFRWCNARRLKKFKATIAAPPTMAKVFGNGKFREKPWPISLFEDLEDGDEMKKLLQIKTRVDGRIEELIRASTHDYVGVSIEVQCNIGTESLRSIHLSLQWPEFKLGQVSSHSRKSRQTPKSTISVISFKGDKEVDNG